MFKMKSVIVSLIQYVTSFCHLTTKYHMNGFFRRCVVDASVWIARVSVRVQRTHVWRHVNSQLRIHLLVQKHTQ